MLVIFSMIKHCIVPNIQQIISMFMSISGSNKTTFTTTKLNVPIVYSQSKEIHNVQINKLDKSHH